MGSSEKIQHYLERVPIDKKPVSGRGAMGQVSNRFHQRSYGVFHEEGIDDAEEEKEPTRYLEVYPRTILNRVESPDLPFRWSLNPYQGCEHGCSYCYARPTHEYWGYSAGLDFERLILIKRNAPVLLEMALRQRSWEVAPISLSGATDPYQPRERRERLTRRLLEVAYEFRQPLTVITKNALVERDLDILQDMARAGLIHVAISLTTLNEGLRRTLEPRTSTGLRRLQAMDALARSAVPVMAMIAPIIPALNEPELPALLRASADAGAITAGYTVIRTNGSVQPVFEAWLHHHFPDRASKVLSQVRDLHGGTLHDHMPGRRMKGEGAFATNLSRLFEVLKKRYFNGRSLPPLDTSSFRPPPLGQLDLFP
jgi:DNA repair photolyase